MTAAHPSFLSVRDIHFLPDLVRIEQSGARCDALGPLPQILLIDGAGVIDQEGHDSRIAVLGGPGDQREAAQLCRAGKLTDCLLRLRRTTVSSSIARNASKNEPIGKGSMTIKYPPRPRTRIPS